MGFLSKVWGGIKDVFKGVMKVFEPILEPLGKLMNSDLGKAIMIGLSIFTLGTAMVAGYGAFTAAMAVPNTSFASAFMQGASAFMSSMTGGAVGKAGPTGGGAPANMVKTAGKNLAETAQTASNLATGGPAELVGTAAEQAFKQGGAMGDVAAGVGGSGSGTIGVPPGAKDITQSAIKGAGDAVSGGGALREGAAAAGPTKDLAAAGGELATRTPPGAGQDPGWLSKAAKAAGDFVKSDSGGNIVGSLIQGVGNYYTEKDRQEFEDRIRRQWGKGTGDEGIRGIRESSAKLGTMRAPSAQDIARTSRGTANEGGGRPYFDRAYGAAGG